jgi:hypothetical protein
MDLTTLLDYHGTSVADPLLNNYLEAFNNFCQFQFDNPYFGGSCDKAFIKWNRQYQPTPKLITQIPTFPTPSMANNNSTLPIVVSATSTSTTTLMNENHEPDDAVNQLVADYLDDDIQQILSIKPLDNFVNFPTSSTSSSSSISPPPELQSFPTLLPTIDLCHSSLPLPPPLPPPPSPPPTPTTIPPLSPSPEPPKGKDISVMLNHAGKKKNKRKRTANILPIQHPPSKRRSGRPTNDETLMKLANNELDNNHISSQNLILRAIDGSEKKKKTILTCSTENIELYNLKQFSCYEFLGELRKKALDIIK